MIEIVSSKEDGQNPHLSHLLYTPDKIMAPTNRFRWARKKNPDGAEVLVLQQLWYNMQLFSKSCEEWREIPVVDDEANSQEIS